MKPNTCSPQSLQHEVPDVASESSKLLSGYYSRLLEEIKDGKWQGISISDISLVYNTDDGYTEVKIIYKDRNNHIHQFTMQFFPDNSFRDTDEDSFSLTYQFCGKFDENARSIRSFVNYLADYLYFEGLEVTPFVHPYTEINKENKYIVKYTEGLNINYEIVYAYEAFSTLIDITLSHIKPLIWFYTEEPNIKSFDEVCYYLAGVKSKLQLESFQGRWQNVKPRCFTQIEDKTDKMVILNLVYTVVDVWKLFFSVIIVDSEGYLDMECTFNCDLNDSLSDGIKEQLYDIFTDFLLSLNSFQDNIAICVGSNEHMIDIKYFYIDDTFEILCKMLDEIVPALQSFNFQLPLHPASLTKKNDIIIKQLGTKLHTTFEVVTEEEHVNNRLKYGYFFT